MAPEFIVGINSCLYPTLACVSQDPDTNWLGSFGLTETLMTSDVWPVNVLTAFRVGISNIMQVWF